jgi:hypothetical protein
LSIYSNLLCITKKTHSQAISQPQKVLRTTPEPLQHCSLLQPLDPLRLWHPRPAAVPGTNRSRFMQRMRQSAVHKLAQRSPLHVSFVNIS